MITVTEEKAVDYEITARLATEAFGSSEVSFSAERMKWLYERAFSQGTIVLAADDDGGKIGQMALVRQTIQCDGEAYPANQLVDLFISREYRSPALIRRIYKEIEQLCATQNVRFILAMPNENAKPLNARMLKLKPLLRLRVRAGIALMLPRLSKLRYSGYVKSLPADDAADLLSGFTTANAENGLHWDGKTLLNRLSDPTCDYAIHVAADLLLVSSSRRTKGVNYTLLCGFFARPSAAITPGLVRELIRAACHFWKRPLFVYAGVNDRLPSLPGISLPTRLRPPMLVQLRDLGPDRPDIRLSRFQLIDSDFV